MLVKTRAKDACFPESHSFRGLRKGLWEHILKIFREVIKNPIFGPKCAHAGKLRAQPQTESKFYLFLRHCLFLLFFYCPVLRSSALRDPTFP